MTDRRPSEPWETNAPGPYLTMPRERGTITFWASPGVIEVRCEGAHNAVRQVASHIEAESLAVEWAPLIS